MMVVTAASSSSKQVGHVLVERGLVTSEQINRALAEQKQSGQAGERKLLGELVVELGYCTEEQVLSALAEAYGVPYVKLGPRLYDPRLMDALPRDFMEKQCVLPLFKVDGVLSVAMHEPANMFLVEELSRLAAGPIQVVAAGAADIKSILQSSLIETEPADEIRDLLQDAAGAADAVAPSSPELSNPREADDGAPVIKLANYIISAAVREGASDIHIEPDDGQLRVRYRIDGSLMEKFRPPVSMQAALVARIKIMAALDISERRLPQDGAIHIRTEGRRADIRVSTLPNRYGEKVVLRIIDNRNVLVDLEELGFEAATLASFRRQIQQPHGLLLVTGPTGSGKSTTLYSALTAINAPAINICTVEDPIEFNLVGVNQFQVNDKIGFTFASTLRSLLRQDPDVIMIGEIRDAETARIAVQAALTGHMVFSTLHTNDAPGAVTRLHNVGVETYLISASLVGVLAQRLVRRLCSHCRMEAAPSLAAIAAAERAGQKLDRVFVGAGCPRCRKTGYSGRIGLFEMLVPDDEIRDAISAGASLTLLREHARRARMKSLLEDGFDKVREGQTTIEELMSATAM